MAKMSVLVELARLELDTLQVLAGLNVDDFDKPTERLIVRAEAEHARRAEELKQEINRHYWATPEINEEIAKAAKPRVVGSETIETAETAEERLSKMYSMASTLIGVPLIRELATEQQALWRTFSELKRASTLKMKVVAF